MAGRRVATTKRSQKKGVLAWTGRLLLRFLQLSVFLVLLCALSWVLLRGYHWVLNTPRLQIASIQISGNHHYDDQQIVQLAGIELGANLIALHIKKTKAALENDPWIAWASIRRDLPQTVRIRVREREPVFWIQKDEALYYADQQGQAIGPVQVQGFVALPYLLFDETSLDQSDKLNALCSSFARKELPFSLAESSWVRFLAGGEIVEFFLQGRQIRIRLDTRELKMNIDSLRHIWRDLDERQELGETFMIWVSGRLGWVKKENLI